VYGTDATINLPAQLPDKDYYLWRVTPIGPLIDSPKAPGPFKEPSAPSGLWRFSVEGRTTRVDLLDPPSRSCQPIDWGLRFRWGNVAGAQNYHLWISELRAIENEFWTTGVDVHYQEFAHIEGPNEQVHQVNDLIGNQPGFKSGNEYVAGYRWRVQAFGPNGLPGLFTKENGAYERESGFYICPTTPTLITPVLTPAPGQLYKKGEEVILEWSSLLTHGAAFYIGLYHNANCAGSSTVTEKKWTTFVSGRNSFALSERLWNILGIAIASNTQYSCRVWPQRLRPLPAGRANVGLSSVHDLRGA